MTKGEVKEWKKECKRYEKELGYVPAEIQMLPMILGLVERGVVEMGSNDDFGLIIKSKEDSNESN